MQQIHEKIGAELFLQGGATTSLRRPLALAIDLTLLDSY